MTRIFVATLLASLTAFGCTRLRQVTRNEIGLAAAKGQTHDGITMKATVTDLTTMQKDPRLFIIVPAQQQTNLGPADKQMGWLLLNPPVLELRVTNQTGHVLKFTGTVLALIDAAGNRYDATTKEKLAAEQRDALAILAKQGTSITAEGQRQIDQAVRRLKFLDENVQLLPDIADTYFLSFDLPVEPTYEAVNAWLAEQTSLRLAVFEVPTETNAAGAITKRTAFEFPLVVKTFRDTYEDQLFAGSKLLKTEEVAK